MKAALLALVAALALAAPAGAEDLSTCSGLVGYTPIAADAIGGGSSLCRAATGVDLVSPPAHGALDLRLESQQLPMEAAPAPMLSWTYLPAAGTPVGTDDHFSYQVRYGDRLSPVATIDIRITAPAAAPVTYAQSAPPALTVAVTSRRRPLRLRARCDVACTTTAVARWRGRVVARATAGPLVLAVPKRARRVTVEVTALAAGGATTTERLGVTLRG